MADVFVSYKAEDRISDPANGFEDRVGPLVSGLTNEGLDVWAMTRLRGGARFIREVNAQLAAARCIVVVWSARSIESDWVLEEATEGLERLCLVPLRIDSVKLLVPFGTIQTFDFVQWRGDTNALVWRDFVAEVRRYCQKGSASGQGSSTTKQSKDEQLKARGQLAAGDAAPKAHPPDSANDLDRAKGLILSTLEKAGGRVPSARLAQIVNMAFPKAVAKGKWFGNKSFGEFITAIKVDLVIEPKPPGHVRLAAGLVSKPKPATAPAAETPNAELAASKSSTVTGPPGSGVDIGDHFFELTEAPLLLPEQFAAVYEGIAGAIRAKRQSLTSIIEYAGERLRDTPNATGRGRIKSVLKSAMIAGLTVDDASVQGSQVGYYFASYLYRLCKAKGWTFTPEEGEAIVSLLGISREAMPDVTT